MKGILFPITFYLKDAETLFSGDDALRFMCDDVESHGLGEGTALSDGDDVAFLDGEAWRTVHGDVLVAFFETTVFGNVMQIVPSNDDGSLHLGGDDESLEDSSADANISGKGALFIDVIGFDGGVGRFDSKSNVLDPAHGFGALISDGSLSRNKDSILLLIGFFVLIALAVFTRHTNHDD
jgi:hypothetical protein